jgi:nitrogenase-associated protein
MSLVTFYEKPGCSGNARQRALLETAGHTVGVRDLLKTPWTRLALLSFFDGLPVADWFNRNAPAVKNGDIVPEQFDQQTAVALLQADPLLIRRPLLEAEGERRVGFDVGAIDAWIGLPGVAVADDPEACRHGTDGHICQGHEEASHEHGRGHVR